MSVQGAEVWRRLPGEDPVVALTFDDCDDRDAWKAILDALADRGAVATFFPNGFRVEEMPDLARRTVAEGHRIGSHGYDHTRPTELSSEALRERLERDAAIWGEVARASPRPWFRPAFGARDQRVDDVAAAAGYPRIAMWDVDPEDWRNESSSAIAGSVVEASTPGSIVLLHARPATAEALPRIVVGLRDRALEPIPLPPGSEVRPRTAR